MTASLLSALLSDESIDAAAIAARARAWEDMATSVAERVRGDATRGTLTPETLTDAALDMLALAQDLEVTEMECAA